MSLPINSGGVLRCCCDSLAQHLEADGKEDEGTVVQCIYCKGSVIVKDGVWRWNKDA